MLVDRMFFLMINSSALDGLMDYDSLSYNNINLKMFP